MTDLNQYRVQWTGLTGMPGVSTFYNTGAVGPMLTRIRAFYDTLKGSIPAGITFKFPSSGNVIDSTTGLNKAGWVATAPADVVSTATGNFAAPVGFMVRWNTAIYANGRQLRGKTFIVPLAAGNYDNTGRLTSIALSSYQAAADAMCVGTEPFVIYSRRNRLSGVVTTANVVNKAVVLRSRRD